MKSSATLLALFAASVPCAAAQEVDGTSRTVVADGAETRVATWGLADRAPGQPVVILQSGAGSPLELWTGLPARLAELGPVIAYDRPGIGGSPYDGKEPGFERMSAHLEALLRELGAGPPYLLVGHSWGGPLIQHFAASRLEDVVGLVFVDPTDWVREGPFYREVLESAAPAGATVEGMMDELNAFMQQMVGGAPPGVAAEMSFIRGFMASPPDGRTLPRSLPVPTAVLLAGGVDPSPPGAPAYVTEAFLRSQNQARVRRFLESVSTLERGYLLFAPHAGHYLHWDDPNLVVEAIRRVLDPPRPDPPGA